MDSVILILGDVTDDVADVLEKYYKSTVDIIGKFKTPSEFHDKYIENPLRVNRIIVSESSLIENPMRELSKLKDVLSSYFVKYDSCYMLKTDNEEISNYIEHIREEMPPTRNFKIYDHSKYTVDLYIGYSLNKISRKHSVKTDPERIDIIRKRIDGTTTFKLDDKEDENKFETIVVEKSDMKQQILLDKLSRLRNLSFTLKNDVWENNKIIKEISALQTLQSTVDDLEEFNIDYYSFKNASRIRTDENNVIIVTGMDHTGKSSLSYALGASYGNSKKILVVDCTSNYGLSFLVETGELPTTAILVQDFINDFEGATRTLIESKYRFNSLVGNLHTNRVLGENPTKIISLIINSMSKYFDIIIVDIPLQELIKESNLYRNAYKTLITVPNRIPSLISLINTVEEYSLSKEFFDDKTIVVPMDMYKNIKSKNLSKPILKKMLNTRYPELKILPEIELVSFNVGAELYKTIESI